MHEQEAREGVREPSLEPMDVAEERVELYADARETGREQRYSIRVTSHTSIRKDRQGESERFILLYGGEKYEEDV